MNNRSIEINMHKFAVGGIEAKLLGALLLRDELLMPHKKYAVQFDGVGYDVCLSHCIVPRARSNRKNIEGMRYSVLGLPIAEGTFGQVGNIATLAVENGVAVIANPKKSRVAKVQMHWMRSASVVAETERFENECKQTLKAEYLHAKSPFRLFNGRLAQSFMVMRKFDGPALADLIAQDAIYRHWYPLSFESRINDYQPVPIHLMNRIDYSLNLLCAVYEQAHLRKVVHYDIKPDNLIVDVKTNMITLVDFGCARDFDEVRPKDIYLGTEGYIAPEVRLDHRQFSLICRPDADLYSAGISLRNLWGDNSILFDDNGLLDDSDMDRGLLLIDDVEQRQIVRGILTSLTAEDADFRMPLIKAIDLFKQVRESLQKKLVLPVLGESSDSIDAEIGEPNGNVSPRF